MTWIKQYGVLIFILLLTAHCVLIYTGQDMGRIVTKLLLVPVLMTYLYASVPKERSGPSPVAPFVALFFSFLGDLFLTQTGEIFFLLGMAGFIITHISNSIYFLQLQRFSLKKPLPALLALVIIGTAVFFVFRLMQDNLGAFKVPILIYMGIIGCMGILATNVILNPAYNKVAVKWLIPGAAFFILSDAMLALDKFYFHQPGVWNIPVMLTYGVAQLLLVVGIASTHSTSLHSSPSPWDREGSAK